MSKKKKRKSVQNKNTRPKNIATKVPNTMHRASISHEVTPDEFEQELKIDLGWQQEIKRKKEPIKEVTLNNKYLSNCKEIGQKKSKQTKSKSYQDSLNSSVRDLSEEKKILEKNIRHKIYYYNDYQFVDIEKECDKRKIILTNFANISIANNYDNDLIIDITSALQSMIGAEHIIYLLEQFFSKMNTKTTIIVDVCKLEDVKKFLKLLLL